MIDGRPNRARAIDLLGRVDPDADTFGSTRPATNGLRANRFHAVRQIAQMDMGLAIQEARSPHAVRVNIVGRIGECREGPFTTALGVARVLKTDRHAPVRVAIDSDGGDLAEGWRIHDELRNRKNVTVTMIGHRAHSAASIVMLGNQYRIANPMSEFLLHPTAVHPDYLAADRLDASRLRSLAAEMDDATRRMIAAYEGAARPPVPLSPGEFGRLVRANARIGSMQARRLGLVDGIELPSGRRI